MNTTTLKTNHLILRKLKPEDTEAIFRNWASDPEVTKYVTWLPHPNVETTQALVRMWLKEEENPKTVRYMITEKESDEPIGSIDVVDYVDGIPEIGYCLSRKHWGKGYMTEACQAFVKYLFAIGFDKIVIEADVNNAASNKVIQKCGFSFTHVERKEHNSALKPEPVTVNWYEIKK
ncbi:MAG: GNAT family N-acetyltransferase [Bacilli bacterium]|nr:GNAT family N-acetyltransferase [Bacilli bacterium]